MPLDELYQEIILDHYRNPRHKGPCPHCGRSVQHDNPLCGDEITLGVEVQGGCIKAIAHDGHGCSISQASASMMTEAALGQPVERVLALGEAVRRMMHGEAPDAELEEALGDLMALEGVAKFPVRIKCALLPWMALSDALSGDPDEEVRDG
jgi:nitrogen fixation NifU-like protein